MAETLLPEAGLRYLLDHTGIETLYGVDADALPRLTEAERQTVQQEGLLALQKQGLLQVDSIALQVDPDLHQMLEVMKAPEAVVRVRRQMFGQAPELFWCFIVGPAFVKLAGLSPGPYSLALLDDETALLDTIAEFLPLQPASPQAYTSAQIAQNDAIDLWDLSIEDGSRAALDLLVSSGLAPMEAEDFFDALRAGTFGGRVNVMTLHDGQIEEAYGLLVVQGADAAWMARPLEHGSSTLLLDMVVPGSYRTALEGIRAALNPT